MRITNDGLTLWYATPDAPAPFEDGASRVESTLTIGTQPPSPVSAVTVHYRIDGGREWAIPAREAGIDHTRQVQYFRASFPQMPEGKVVDYGAVLTCAGRQVPAPRSRPDLPSRFTLADPTPPPAVAPSPQADPNSARFTPNLEFIAQIRTRFTQNFDIIGETPIGFRVNYYLQDGDVRGPRLKGRVLRSGGDYLLIRRDGIASVQVYATFETNDGAIFGADYYGIVDLGPDGYERAVRGHYPTKGTLQLAPRFMTGDPRYAWLNRHQFVGVGEVRPMEGAVEYDLFLVDNDPDPLT